MPEFVMLIAGNWSREIPPEVEGPSTAKVIAWFEEHTKKGTFVANAGRRLEAPHTAKTVVIDDGAPIVVDGPYAETKEQVGGYALLNVPDMAAAIDLVKTWPGLPTKIEVRPVFSG